ncbi:MAG: hypothetical protein EA387_00795 [Nitriliruptor sp.]|nr:MAG: hypothetical protein EA387_00795 [Nitriliruptor sp.]
MATTPTTTTSSTSRPVLLGIIVVLLLGGGVALTMATGDGFGQLLTRTDRIDVELAGYRITPERIVLPAEETVTLELSNTSVFAHNLAIGRDPVAEAGRIIGFGEDLLAVSEVRTTPRHALVRPADVTVPTTISVEPGTTVEVELRAPTDLRGVWEFGCFQGSGCEAHVGVSASIVVQ